MDDTEILRELRNKALYDGYKNSIVEWTLSNEWLDVEWALPNPHRGQTFDGATYVFGTSFQGEFTCTH